MKQRSTIMAASWGAVDFDWRLIPLLIFAWYLLLKRWERDGVLDRWNATCLRIRVDGTAKKGLDVLKSRRPRRFWRIYERFHSGSAFAMLMVGVVFCLLS